MDLIERSKAIDAIMAEDCLGYVECQTEWLTEKLIDNNTRIVE